MNARMTILLLAGLLATGSRLRAAQAEPLPAPSEDAPAAERPSEQENYTLGIENFYGFRGNLAGVFPDSHPPTAWGEDLEAGTSKNVLWKAPVPHWGLAAPLAVKDRVFVLSELGWKHDFPVLTCYAAADGTVLWEREINHLHRVTSDKSEQQELAARWHEIIGKYENCYRAKHHEGQGKNKSLMSVDEQTLAKYGLEKTGRTVVPKGWTKSDKSGGPPELRAIAEKAFLILDGWWRDGSGDGVIGTAFATPCSDGENVYVSTPFRSYACYSLDGDLCWMTWAHEGEACCPATEGHGTDFCREARSPILWRDLLISDQGWSIKAFHKKTGSLRWKHALDQQEVGRNGYRVTQWHSVCTPIILNLNGTDVLWSSIGAVRLHDARALPVTWLTGNDAHKDKKRHGDFGAVVDDENDMIFISGTSNHTWYFSGIHNRSAGELGGAITDPPWAFKLTLEGEALTAKLVWKGKRRWQDPVVFYRGKLYSANGVILDAMTGDVLAGQADSKDGKAAPASRHHLFVAGDHVYGWDSAKTDGWAKGEVYTLDGKKVAENTLSVQKEGLSEDKRQQRIVTVGSEVWRRFNCAGQFTVSGNRLYFRSYDHLYCIGKQ